jgi:uncharacterized membrane protein
MMPSIMADWLAHAIPVHAFRRSIDGGGKKRLFPALGGGALVLYGLGRRGVSGVTLAAVGGALVARGATGRCNAYRSFGVHTAFSRGARGRSAGGSGGARAVPGVIRVQRSITIGKPREELYRFLRDFSNLPRFMLNLEQVKVLGDTRSRWVMKGPLGTTVAWDVEIVESVENERIAWRSAEPRRVTSAGAVVLAPAPGGRGTEVTVILDYDPPGGLLGGIVTLIRGGGPEMLLRGDLRRLRQLVEACEIPTTVGQPSGRADE